MAVITCTIEYLGDTIDGVTGEPVTVTLTDGTGSGETGTVTSVNSQTGAVVLGAADVDADPAGSADTAQTTAEAYTDAQIAAEVTRADAAYDAAGAAAAAQTASEAYTDAAIDALPASGAVDSVNGQTGTVTLDYTDVGADPAGAADGAQAAAIAADPVPSDGLPRSLGTSDPGVGVAFSRWDHIHPMPSSSDIGAATAAQGALADTAVQPADLATVATTGAYSDLSGTPTIPDSADDIGAVPTTRTVNSKALSADITLSASDVSAVPTTRTVNSKALSADIALGVADISGAISGLTSDDDSVTITDNGDGTLDLAASGGGSAITAARANTTASVTLTHGTGIQVAWENEDYDDASYHDTVTNNSRFTAPATGRYRFTFGYAVSAARAMYLSSRLNGATIISYATGIGDSGTSDGQCVAQCSTGIIAMSSGDYIEALVQMFKAGGSGTTTRATGVPAWACFERLS